ncbi:MFS transporter [Komagataeibacter rhaeticus]|nr:glucose/galactose MFS transporter [Komagataeibacter rhaeticus]WPP21929.1 glucose/galactose MFS transporter [Komagataeibacter rhaeticus]SAY48040.1 L-fucose-proton symporter [Komagataeibacter rhaeticus]
MGGDQASVGQGTYGRRPLMVMGGLFFVIGFVTWLNGPLITFVQVAFGLGPVGAFLVPLCFYLSYLVCAFPAMAVARWTGLRGGISLALAIMAGGTLLFGECVGRLWYPGALGGLSVLGAGLTLLQVTVNPYVTLLGAPGRAAGRIAIMGIANKVSGIIAPVVFSLLVMPDIGGVVARLAAAVDGGQRAGVLAAFARAVVVPYRGLALVLLLAAVGLRHAGLPALCLPAPRMPAAMRRMPVRAWVGVGIVFVYVGVEVMAGDGIGLYGRGMGLSLGSVRFLTSLTLGAMLAGYGVGTLVVPARCGVARYLAGSAALGIVLCLVAACLQGAGSVACIALLGLANAMMMPIVFPLVLHAAGDRQDRAAALLVMAFSGGAVMPQVFALLIGPVGMQVAFIGLMTGSYLLIGLYALVLSAWAAHPVTKGLGSGA